MAKRPLPTPAELRQLLRYDAETGKLVWLARPVEFFDHCAPEHRLNACKAWNAAWAGKKTGYQDRHGYIYVTLFHRRTSAHRIAWCLETGKWPAGQIDHKNGKRDDNRFENLRDVSNAENHRNLKLNELNTSGVAGVYWCPATKKWRAEVICNRQRYRLGRFSELGDAAAAVAAKRLSLGFSPAHGHERRGYDAWRKKVA